MITYSELIGHVRPFFLSRGGDELAGNDRMMFYANCSIQDIYNNDNATFTYKTETIAFEDNGTTHKFTTEFNVRKVQECIGTFIGGGTVCMTPELYIKSEYDKDWVKFETGSNILVAHKDIVSIEVVYIKEYRWATYPADLAEVIQLPLRYVPAACKLMYDWASPVNLMSGETAQVDFFAHAQKRMKDLADDDSLTDNYQLRSSR